ncbi:RHS repeat-associated core domain-containing protein [Undibacterium sp.]|uniref:RHS repeat-associated core domain-containing protein n=1 Tax=Undibacterium sp. TaxID=1914977 RepID=UPI00272FA8F5|nr:RHS repeat-associated core domain-containing protein [Undibacterium sp.]MDP1978693.1 RHS repeat-associated core domain-containing protein [Undibacterium sp.]
MSKDSIAYNVNGLNQATAESDIAYQYDQNGNLIAKITPIDSYRYSYDALSRMISTEGPYGTVTYTYDSFGRRLSQLHNTDTTQYLYQGQCKIGSYSNGEWRELRILGKGKGAELGAAIAIEIADKAFAPIHDNFGNVCCLVNSSTGEAQCYRYTAFEETTSHGIVQNPWQYASKRFDGLTGFHRFGKRDYDCRLGRWLTPDPAGFVDGPNLYAYVHNSPMTLFDPWGLQGQYNKPIGKPEDRGRESSGIKLSDHCFGVIVFLANNFSKEIRERSARFAHHTLSTLSEYGSALPHVQQSVQGLYDDFAGRLDLPQFSTNPMANYSNGTAGGHQIIDQMFSTNYAPDYTPEMLDSRRLDIAVGTLPFPGATNITSVVFRKSIQVTKHIWSSTKSQSFVQNAYRHWKDHRHDFPSMHNAKQYVEAARDFINAPPSDVLTKIRLNGDTIFYSPSSNTFVVSNRFRLPRTMYKPNPAIHKHQNNLEYFYEQ